MVLWTSQQPKASAWLTKNAASDPRSLEIITALNPINDRVIFAAPTLAAPGPRVATHIFL